MRATLALRGVESPADDAVPAVGVVVVTEAAGAPVTVPPDGPLMLPERSA